MFKRDQGAAFPLLRFFRTPVDVHDALSDLREALGRLQPAKALLHDG
jgi:hypothetical protein